MTQYTSSGEFKATYERLHETFKTGRTKDLKWRKWQLKQCWWLLTDNQDAIVDVLRQDLNRPPFESVLTDINTTKNEIVVQLNNLEAWAKGEAPVGAGFVMGTLGQAWLRKEPLGVVFVIGAWNFPLYTLLAPAVGAIAAGNCVLMKPSEQARATQDLLKTLAIKYLDTSAIALATGAAQETGYMLEHKFNHICYTGGSKVGRIIAGAAAKHLTPVTLELGGQNPTIVTKSANVDLAAKRIANTKLINAGQICLNVNHVLADPAIHDQLAERIKYYLSTWLKEGEKAEISSIVSVNHYQRIKGLLDASSGTTIYTGSHREEDKFIHPTIITGITPTDSLMSEELFAPLIPMIKADLESTVKIISDMPSPLGMYIFSSSQAEIDFLLERTSSGGVTINDVMMHNAVPGAPFGGVGESGYGAYQGKASFDTFSHTRCVVGLPDWLDMAMGWRYYPWKLENSNKTATTPRVSFKRGETMEDQYIARSGLLNWFWSEYGNRKIE